MLLGVSSPSGHTCGNDVLYGRFIFLRFVLSLDSSAVYSYNVMWWWKSISHTVLSWLDFSISGTESHQQTLT
uniref:Uncharacterized protein n=1 Tax=Oryza brachyantha TaxID=4533 RepID=J3N8F0_ORYBR